MLAFDFGTRKIGVAVGNTLVRRRASVDDDQRRGDGTPLRGDRALCRRVAAAGARRRTARARRRHAARDDRAVPTASRARSRAAFGLPVVRVDERFTTAGRRRGAARGRRARRGARGSARRRGGAADPAILARRQRERTTRDPA